MATQETDLSFYCPDNTTFRAYCTMIRDALVAMGLVQTADTGQINLGTVTIPTALNQDRGYMIFRFNDALQSTKPVFIKVTFRSNISGTAGSGIAQVYYVIGLTFQVGTGTNGAGILTGKVSQQRSIAYYCTSGLANDTLVEVDKANKHLFSGASNRLMFIRGANSSQPENFSPLGGGAQSNSNTCIRHGMFSVERTKNIDGTDSDEGILIFSAGTMIESAFNTWSYFNQYIPYLLPIGRPHLRRFPCFYIGDESFKSTLTYNKITTIPFTPFYGGEMKNPGINQCGYFKNDFTWGGVGIPIEVYGTNKLYRPIENDLFRTFLGSDTTMFADSRMMMIWE